MNERLTWIGATLKSSDRRATAELLIAMMTHASQATRRALLMRGVKRGRVRQTGRGLYRLARRL